MKPEEAAAERLINEMLPVIRAAFFRGRTEKQFYQERNLLLQAIAYPARYLNDRGAKAPASKYRAILNLVIGTIKRHGAVVKIERFSPYFLHSVQEHMRHHGDEYYEEAKEVRGVGTMVAGVMGKMRAGDEARETTDVLVTMHRALRSKGGRKKKPVQTFALEPDLFG